MQKIILVLLLYEIFYMCCNEKFCKELKGYGILMIQNMGEVDQRGFRNCEIMLFGQRFNWCWLVGYVE